LLQEIMACPVFALLFAAVGVLDVGLWSLGWSTKRVPMITVVVRVMRTLVPDIRFECQP
jgi:hypothetical protein